MGLVISKDQFFTDTQVLKAKITGRLQIIFNDWLLARSTLQRHWHKFYKLSGGRRVPYRVWSRYGAYLEIHQASRKPK